MSTILLFSLALSIPVMPNGIINLNVYPRHTKSLLQDRKGKDLDIHWSQYQ